MASSAPCSLVKDGAEKCFSKTPKTPKTPNACFAALACLCPVHGLLGLFGLEKKHFFSSLLA
jgi:hypothetical protein